MLPLLMEKLELKNLPRDNIHQASALKLFLLLWHLCNIQKPLAHTESLFSTSEALQMESIIYS